MADHAKVLVEQNGLLDVVEVMRARAEEAELPEKVDMIVSEWMGTLLIVSWWDGDPADCKLVGWGPC